MSSRPFLPPHAVVTNGDMSTNITSAVTLVPLTSMLSYQVAWTGTVPVGVISVQVSNDYSANADGSVRNAGTWTDLPLSNTPLSVSGATGNGFINIAQLAAYAVRLVYTRTSGSGTMSAIIAGKVA